MLTFAYPYLLLLLLLVPVFVLIYAWTRYIRSRDLKKFGKLSVLAPLMPEVSPYKPPLKLSVRMLALSLIIIAIARPWGGVKDVKTDKEGIEVVIAVDASNSMYASASSDVEGTPRMRTAKLMLEKLINNMDNDKVGLVVFAGEAYTLIPVTGDYISAKMFLNSIDPAQYPNQGTNIADAIDQSIKAFGDDKRAGKAIILITDAEELEDEKSVMDAVKNASKNNIQVDVLGVGTTSAVPVPVNGAYLTDPDTGGPVATALNEDLAAQIAKAGKGIYVNAANRGALNELERQLGTIKKTALQQSFNSVHDELFPIFLWIALVLMVLDIFLLDRKISWLDKITFFKKEEKK
ncbi:MAG: VWA domain-containing protein [Prevotella sp.]|nr:VWA domain-containing protein [Bacteroides sp.]MCM1366620.1 VWA domain-containing protein [Prevotella sp.]MCM1436985.1 VWA domain-containing protein [Prevotella sp.]